MPVALFGMTMPALVFALFAEPNLRRCGPAVLRLAIGPDRPRIHHGSGISCSARSRSTRSASRASNPIVFVLVTALYFGVYGEIFSLFPATQGDTFGAKYAAANAGMLYTAKGAGALLVPIAAGMAKAHGWGTVFTIAMSLQLMAALSGAVRAEAHARARISPPAAIAFPVAAAPVPASLRRTAAAAASTVWFVEYSYG